MNHIDDAYGGEPNNPSAIYMALIFNTDALLALQEKYGDSVMHDKGLANLALAGAWDDPRFDTHELMGSLIGLLMSAGADHDPNVARIIEIASAELRNQTHV